MKSFKMKPYDEDTKEGFLRHVLIKRGFSTGQVYGSASSSIKDISGEK